MQILGQRFISPTDRISGNPIEYSGHVGSWIYAIRIFLPTRELHLKFCTSRKEDNAPVFWIIDVAEKQNDQKTW
jgi:hypothetical protein